MYTRHCVSCRWGLFDWIWLAFHLSHSRFHCCSAQLRSFKWIAQCRKKWSVIRHVIKGELKYGSKRAGCGKEPLEQRDGERQLRQRNVDVAKVIREMEGRDSARVREKRDKIQGGMIIFPYQSPPRRSQMWLWNRWLGQPTKRDADKNSFILAEHRAVQFVWWWWWWWWRWSPSPSWLYWLMFSVIHVAELLASENSAGRLLVHHNCDSWPWCVLSLGCSGSCGAKGAAWSTRSTSTSSSFKWCLFAFRKLWPWS